MVCGEMSITRQANCFRSPPKSRLFQSQYRPGRSTAMPASRRRPAAAASLSGIGLGICRSSGAISSLDSITDVLMNFLSKWLCPPSVSRILYCFQTAIESFIATRAQSFSRVGNALFSYRGDLRSADRANTWVFRKIGLSERLGLPKERCCLAARESDQLSRRDLYPPHHERGN